jgi:hypothetical protein
VDGFEIVLWVAEVFAEGNSVVKISFIGGRTNAVVHWQAGVKDVKCLVIVHWFISSLVHWFIGSLVHWFIGSLVHWFIGSLVHWFIGLLVNE